MPREREGASGPWGGTGDPFPRPGAR